MSKAVVLFSGGLDSTTCLYKALRENEEILALTFDYNQRHVMEIEKARFIARENKVRHIIQKIETGVFLGSSLTDTNLQVAKNFSHKETIPNTYVPGRNILFLSYAVSLAEGCGFDKIYIGVNALDYSGYPDCRHEFIEAFQKAIWLGTKSGTENKPIQIVTPLIHLSKKEIILLGSDLKVPFSMTHSCYDPIDSKPCGICDSCLLRKKGFEEAGIEDK
ncbi:MAG: 7-cyano-7-deazaguanine synthase QueC [Leptospiraceae bacterium]|nr:7-cyano-7-deazaguanine synthase QueC [Leptospiraceae bacterium]MCP5495826.1 7-cyano-7-deazaguanine synthase QueC [Leptospiraceae bacterium]